MQQMLQGHPFECADGKPGQVHPRLGMGSSSLQHPFNALLDMVCVCVCLCVRVCVCVGVALLVVLVFCVCVCVCACVCRVPCCGLVGLKGARGRSIWSPNPFATVSNGGCLLS